MRADEMAKKLAFVTTERTRIANLKCEDVVAVGRAPYTDWIGRMQDADKGDRGTVARLGGNGGLCTSDDG